MRLFMCNIRHVLKKEQQIGSLKYSGKKLKETWTQIKTI